MKFEIFVIIVREFKGASCVWVMKFNIKRISLFEVIIIFERKSPNRGSGQNSLNLINAFLIKFWSVSLFSQMPARPILFSVSSRLNIKLRLEAVDE